MTYYERVVRIYPDSISDIDRNETVSFAKPCICGSFSIDKNREYLSNLSNMMYFYPRTNVNSANILDLNAGIENVFRKGDLCEKLDHMLEFIKRNTDNLLNKSSQNIKLDADFVCFRGFLTKVMCSLYSNDPWSVLATKWNNTIYLCEERLPEVYKISEEEMKKYCSWGYKFEQYMVTDVVGKEPDTNKPVLEAEEFCCLFKSKLGPCKLLYGAEMDAVLSTTTLDESTINWDKIKFVELKTSKIVRSSREQRNLEFYKFIKWWAQCYLVNIDELYCGFRDQHGHVAQIQLYKVRDLPKQAQGAWNWRSCLNFCKIFLEIVKTSVPAHTNDPYSVWKFEWLPRLEHFKTEEFHGPSVHSFLPDDYIKHMKNIFDKNNVF